jgi:hypothetical protein
MKAIRKWLRELIIGFKVGFKGGSEGYSWKEITAALREGQKK